MQAEVLYGVLGATGRLRQDAPVATAERSVKTIPLDEVWDAIGRGEIVIVAAGAPGLISGDDVRPGREERVVAFPSASS